jgi:serine/threonine protein phosphatase PrpC
VPNARFCEACGAEVRALDAATADAPAPAAGPACISCGAPADAIADDGYCGRCGMKQPAPGDHREVDLGMVAAVSDRGLHHHRNEDAFSVAEFDVSGVTRRVVVVCDGVSSTADSHLAAQAAADAARAVLETASEPDDSDLTALTNDAVAAAQTAVCAIPAKDGATPSCTIVTAIASIVDDATASVVVGWLGDSRAYWWRDGALRQISVDDSWATEQIAAGADPASAYADARAHVITRWLGLDAIETTPRVATVEVSRPATLLLCSDGLWNYAATETALADRIRALGPDLANLELARALTYFARDAGGHDNITVAVATL